MYADFAGPYCARMSSQSTRRERRSPYVSMPDQSGRTYVVTGASAGIGFCTAQALAEAGAHVILAVRDVSRGEAAAAQMRGDTVVRPLDVSSLASVRAFADQTGHVDVLINNAGVLGLPEQRSADGFELQMATNHLGHYALTLLLLDRLRDRVVVLGSQAHKSAALDVGNLDLAGGAYSGYRAYANSKLACLLFLSELDRRLQERGSVVRAVGAHPGYTATKIMRNTHSGPFNALAAVGNSFVGMSPEGGANCVLYAATRDVPGNSYVGPAGPFELRGRPTLVGRSDDARDAGLARALWQVSATRTGIGWPAT